MIRFSKTIFLINNLESIDQIVVGAVLGFDKNSQLFVFVIFYDRIFMMILQIAYSYCNL